MAKELLRKTHLLKNTSVVYQRHMQLNKKYKEEAHRAWITDFAEIEGINLEDPFRTVVQINDELQVPFKVGVHRAVGGEHDYPNPGDLLCATLAACLETTLRMIANRLNIKLTRTHVKVFANVDVRGTLRLDLNTPVAFQSMAVEMEVEANELHPKVLDTLIRATKKSCIIYQTLKKGLSIDFKVITK